jgi:hypothetical protein
MEQIERRSISLVRDFEILISPTRRRGGSAPNPSPGFAANLTSASDTADGRTQAVPRTFRDLKECRRFLAEQPSEAAIEFIMG